MRSTIKWGGAVVTVLLLIVWVGSKWYNYQISIYPLAHAEVFRGRFNFSYETPWSRLPDKIDGDAWKYPRQPLDWWFETRRLTFANGTVRKTLLVPVWFVALIAVMPTLFVWLPDRKPLPGVCLACGYSRTGLPADRACPECGSPSRVDLKHGEH
jgi:hypothetical protein